ncbi:hypothetical protein LSCM1_06054 [Leishmania martiniquensis]|uniref:EF-hand domain-containing protein n=1 Tax=Leishmania martiniquensis TaxID=1580590 RepID=A0A836H6S8_9TRYP|nr:hypothetical protein LSCM1_06054 [Leishmania martiniquensis]
MPRTAELVEDLARRYYLTTALVEEAGRLFDAYAGSGDAPPANGSTEPFISVSALQQLSVKIGKPLSQQDVVELLRFFGSATAVGINEQGKLPQSPAKGHQSPSSKGSQLPREATVPASQQPSRQRRKKNGATEPKSGNKDAPASFPMIASSHSAGDKRGSDAASANTSTAAPLAATARVDAVTERGMNFSAFLYFLLIYPELTQQVSATAATSSTSSSAALRALHDSVPALFAMIDTDGDGVWSMHDLRYAAEACLMEDNGLLQEDPDLCCLAEMHPAELAAVLHELDVDGDGVVTVDDVQQALCH